MCIQWILGTVQSFITPKGKVSDLIGMGPLMLYRTDLKNWSVVQDAQGNSQCRC